MTVNKTVFHWLFSKPRIALNFMRIKRNNRKHNLVIFNSYLARSHGVFYRPTPKKSRNIPNNNKAIDLRRLIRCNNNKNCRFPKKKQIFKNQHAMHILFTSMLAFLRYLRVGANFGLLEP